MSRNIQDSLGPAPEAAGHQVKYIETVDAYNKWAEVYDTDGNFLQALDTIEMHNLLPYFLSRIQAESAPGDTLKLVDLGCGTGRNTLQLANLAPPTAQIIGIDASPGMLAVAKSTLEAEAAGAVSTGRVTLGEYDLLSPMSPIPVSLQDGGASGIISTLVLEHITVGLFFEGAARLIKPGGYFLVTNMHAEMGAISQAGFVDERTGTKIRPTSYAHAIGDVVAAAERVGFEVIALDEAGERVRETKVEQGMVKALGVRGKKWVGVTVWFGICFAYRPEMNGR
ncbi:S-adenosyl-L-methionine-dependent methyltransferase [Aspergillus pseudoustus]|uniref:S-adenosyl-L-methionine-dependent methyltransferase n=1 Tax=Aspergillus pseudoustus TaxID=1810923 RepID=A0ABR4KU75_9EURO